MCNINIDSERSSVFCLFVWGLFDWHCLHFAALWLRLSAGAAEVMFWFAVMVPVSPTLASGYSHYPLASTLCPAQTLRSPIPWQLAWLLLLTADATFHELLPPHTPTHLSSPSLLTITQSSMMNKIFIFVCECFCPSLFTFMSPVCSCLNNYLSFCFLSLRTWIHTSYVVLTCITLLISLICPSWKDFSCILWCKSSPCFLRCGFISPLHFTWSDPSRC